MKLAKHLLFHKTGSKDTLYYYAESVYRFCRFLNETPDSLVEQCLDKDGIPNPKAVLNLTHDLEDFMDHLRCQNLAPHTIASQIKALRSFFGVNGIRISFPFRMSVRSLYEVRAVSPGELQKLIGVADLREKVIISIMATSGLREGTLAKLRYRNVKSDIERNVVPALVSVEAEITKGKYHSYYTCLNEEAAEYLKAYIKAREIGTRGIPSENICDESPIIRARSREIRFTNSLATQKVIHNLLAKAGLISPDSKCKRYDLAGYSLRKYFKTQLTSAGVHTDYTEFMMGHKISSYHDVKMKGTDYLRGVYLSAGLRMQPRIKLNKIDALKEIMVELTRSIEGLIL
jgi:site-specific recombinase XerD